MKLSGALPMKDKKVLITGGSGVLGQALSNEMIKDYDVLLLDTVKPKNGFPWVKADMRRYEEVKKATEGCNMVMHVGAIHPWKKYADEEYLDINIKGTWNVLSAAQESGIKKVVYTSSIWARGHLPNTPDFFPIDERTKRPPNELYGLTKWVGEETCELFSGNFGMATIVLRAGTFIPKENSACIGFELLTSRVDRRDLISAHILAAKSNLKGHHFFSVVANSPFSDRDLRNHSLEELLKRDFPRALKTLKKEGFVLPKKYDCWSIKKAKKVLGYSPKYNFKEWWEEYEKNETL